MWCRSGVDLMRLWLAVVDLAAKKVIQVVDTGVVPVPKDPWGYTEAEIERRTGLLRPTGNPALLGQTGGPNFTIDGSAVRWDIWRFRYRVDKRPGVVLSQIEVDDGGTWRSALYQAHLSEVFIPYMDPDRGERKERGSTMTSDFITQSPRLEELIAPFVKRFPRRSDFLGYRSHCLRMLNIIL